MKFYNTLTRKKEEFTPLNGNTVRMYTCGPTVYNYAHIGNMRTYIFMDLLKRALKYNGYKVKDVMNITDVGHLLSDGDEGEDKMELASKREQKSPYEIAAHYTEVFLADLKKLNISLPAVMPRATAHIKEMLEIVEKLYDDGYGYETPDGIYFDISKFPSYGMLSGINLDEQKAGARVEVNDFKRNPYDFALWKKAPKEHIMQWESRWGMGYPGWHIECSAMSRKYLGDEFDIHTGGVDHIPIHHENEIAQSCCYSGKIPAKVWMHGEFLLVDNGKMSKKLGNCYTISQLEEKGYKPVYYRYFCLNAHYRKKLNFTFEGLDGAKSAYERLAVLLLKHKASEEKTDASIIAKYLGEFERAISDDLNIPEALGVLWTMLKEAPSNDIYNAALEMDKVFGLSLSDVVPSEKADEAIDIPEEVKELAEQRMTLKRQKDFKNADVLRDKISSMGYNIVDMPDKYTIVKK